MKFWIKCIKGDLNPKFFLLFKRTCNHHIIIIICFIIIIICDRIYDCTYNRISDPIYDLNFHIMIHNSHFQNSNLFYF